jgi:hypothetical protein
VGIGGSSTYRFITRKSAMIAAWFVVIEYRLHMLSFPRPPWSELTCGLSAQSALSQYRRPDPSAPIGD